MHRPYFAQILESVERQEGTRVITRNALENALSKISPAQGRRDAKSMAGPLPTEPPNAMILSGWIPID